MSKSTIEFDSRPGDVHQRLITNESHVYTQLGTHRDEHTYPYLGTVVGESASPLVTSEEPALAPIASASAAASSATDRTLAVVIVPSSFVECSSDKSGSGSGSGPYVWKGPTPSCCRSWSGQIWIWATVIPCIFFIALWIMIIGGGEQLKQATQKERTNVMTDQLQLWQMILHEPLEAGYELQQTLVKQFPQLLSTTPISVDVFNMTTLQTSPGWLSGFAEVATKHPQLRSFGIMAVLNNNDTITSKNQIYIEYIKPLNSTSLDASGRVVIQMNTVDQQLLAFSPVQSLHPPIINAAIGFNQFFPLDVAYTDSSAAIASYLGQSTTLISNHTFDLANTATFQGFQQFLLANETIGYLASQPPTNFKGGIRMIAAAASNIIPSPSVATRFLTFSGYSTPDLNQLLASFPLSSGDAFLISPRGWIIASTNGMEGYNLWTLSDQVLQKIRDFLSDEGLIVNPSINTLTYQPDLRQYANNGGILGPSYSFLAQMIPGLPDNSQLSLVVRLDSGDLTNPNEQLLFVLVSMSVWFLAFSVLIFGQVIFFGPFKRLDGAVRVIWYYYSQVGRRDGVENCIDLLKLVQGWKKNSLTNRPIPPRLAELISIYVPRPGRQSTKQKFVLEDPPRLGCSRWMNKLDDLAWMNELIEKWLYEFVENECKKHMPLPPPRR